MTRLFSSLIIKKGIFLIILSTFSLPGFSQSNILEKVIKVPDYTGNAKELINQIQKTEDILFAYSSNIKLDFEVSFQQRQMKLSEFLDILFKNKSIGYKASGNKILMFPEKSDNKSSQTITIAGTVSAYENKGEILPYAHVQIEGTGYGIISDLEGNFNFKVPGFLCDSTLVISYVGYESEHIPVASFKNNFQKVYLKEAANEISEVVVTPPDPVYILANVLHKLDTNFWQTSFNADGAYREFIVIGNEINRISEAECKFYIEKFRSQFSFRDQHNYYTQTPKYKDFDATISIGWNIFASPFNQVKINKLTHCYSPFPSDIKLNIDGGPMGAFSSDIFASKDYGLQPEKNFEKTCMKFEWLSGASVKYDVWNGRTVYKLSWGSNSSVYKYTLIIDRETYALIGYDRVYRLNKVSDKPLKIARLNKRFKKGDTRKDLISYDSITASVRYMPVRSQWYPFSIVSEYYYTYIPYNKETIHLTGIQELKYSSVTTENATKFDPVECFKFYYRSSITDLPDAQTTEHTLNGEILHLNTLDPDFRKKLLSYSAETNSVIAEQDSLLIPPVALRIADTLSINNENFIDYYSWLEDTEDERVLDYIEHENKYADWSFKQYDTIIHNISRELDRKYIHSLKRNDTIFRGNKFIYIQKDRIEENKYGGILRINKSDRLVCDTILKFKLLEKEYPDCDLDNYTVNHAETIFSYTIYPDGYIAGDAVSVFKNIETGNILDTIRARRYVFVNDTTVLYPMKAIPGCFWESQLYSKVLGRKGPEKLKETEGAIGSIVESESKRYIFIYEMMGDGILFFDRKNPEKGLQVFADTGFQKSLVSFNHYQGFSGSLYTTLSEGKGKLFMSSENGMPSKTDSLIFSSEHEINIEFATDKTIYLSFYDGLKQGLLQYSIKNRIAREIPFPDTLYKITYQEADDNNTLSLQYSTYTEPSKYYRLAVNDTVPTLIGCDSLENYNKKDYDYKILEVEANDGKMIPVVMLYKIGIPLHSCPVYIEFYGGGSDIYAPNFKPVYLPLLDRGIAVVFPIIRGGGELGKEWSDELNRNNLTAGARDLVDVVKYLIKTDITDTSKITLFGGSFSGFLLSYIVNNYPDLMSCAIVDVPENLLIWQLADSTDATVAEEYPSWGSPYVKDELERLKVIDPYENIKQQDYPPMLFYAGWRDINVSPVDAIRTVAKIRHADASNDDIILRVLMNSGHSAEGGKEYTKWTWNFAFALAHIKYKKEKNECSTKQSSTRNSTRRKVF